MKILSITKTLIHSIAPAAVHVALLFIMFSEGGPDIYLHLYEGENEGYL